MILAQDTYRDFEALLASTGQYVTVLHGNSMYPMVRSGRDAVLMVPLDGPLKPYDIAVYSLPDRYVVHRVLEAGPDCCLIRGDNCVNIEKVPCSLIRARVAGYWRFGRYFSADSPVSRAYARIWVRLNPVVRLSHRASALLNAAINKIRRVVKR